MFADNTEDSHGNKFSKPSNHEWQIDNGSNN